MRKLANLTFRELKRQPADGEMPVSTFSGGGSSTKLGQSIFRSLGTGNLEPWSRTSCMRVRENAWVAVQSASLAALLLAIPPPAHAQAQATALSGHRHHHQWRHVDSKNRRGRSTPGSGAVDRAAQAHRAGANGFEQGGDPSISAALPREIAYWSPSIPMSPAARRRPRGSSPSNTLTSPRCSRQRSKPGIKACMGW